MILRGKGDMPGFSQIMDKRDARRILVWLKKARAKKSEREDEPEAAEEAQEEVEEAQEEVEEVGGGGDAQPDAD